MTSLAFSGLYFFSFFRKKCKIRVVRVLFNQVIVTLLVSINQNNFSKNRKKTFSGGSTCCFINKNSKVQKNFYMKKFLLKKCIKLFDVF